MDRSGIRGLISKELSLFKALLGGGGGKKERRGDIRSKDWTRNISHESKEMWRKFIESYSEIIL